MRTKLLLFTLLSIFCFQTTSAQSLWDSTGTNIYYNAGNVGIGTSSPSKPLHIISSTEHHQIRLQGTNDKHAWIQYYPSGTGVLNWQAGVNTNGFSIYDVSNSEYRLTINNSGNVGIGTTTPIAPFHVLDSSFPQIRINNESLGGEAGVRFRSANGSTDLHVDLVTQYSGTGDEQGKFHIRIPWNGPERFTLDHLGNVGIGTTTPATNLHIKGGLSSFPQLRIHENGGTFSLDLGHDGQNAVLKTNHGDFLFENGNVGIGTATPDNKLEVNGVIRSKEVVVEASGWPDFVFYSDYNLPSLEEVEDYITENKHLPEVPSESEVLEHGIRLGEMDATLLQKIEELTLYMIEQNKVNKQQQKLIEELQAELRTLKKE